MVEDKLDRALATPDWMDLFPNVKPDNRITSHLDHSPILLHCEPGQRKRRKYVFRFENYWLKEGIEDIIQNGWLHGENHDVMQRIGSCAEEIENWNRV